MSSTQPPPPDPTTTATSSSGVETSETISTTTPRRHLPAAASLGGYAVTHLREAGGEETLRFEAVITRHGRPIAHVSNGGHGGILLDRCIAHG